MKKKKLYTRQSCQFLVTINTHFVCRLLQRQPAKLYWKKHFCGKFQEMLHTLINLTAIAKSHQPVSKIPYSLFGPSKFHTSIFSSFSWDHYKSKEKKKQWLCKILGGTNKEYYVLSILTNCLTTFRLLLFYKEATGDLSTTVTIKI